MLPSVWEALGQIPQNLVIMAVALPLGTWDQKLKGVFRQAVCGPPGLRETLSQQNRQTYNEAKKGRTKGWG